MGTIPARLAPELLAADTRTMRRFSILISSVLLAVVTFATPLQADDLFAPPEIYKVGSISFLALPFDVDADNLPDLVVFCGDPYIAYVYHNNGFGLDSLGAFDPGDFVTTACVTDFDNDQDPDLAVTNLGDAVVLLFSNNGAGEFQLVNTLPAGGEVKDVAAADLNDDGSPDLIVADPWWSFVSILLSDGEGGFAWPNLIPVDSTSIGVCAADLDGDEDIDVVSTNYMHNGVALLANQGDGTFSPPIYLQFEGTCQHAVTADLDNDNDNDLIVAVYDTTLQYVEVMINQGDLVFTEGGKYTFDSYVWRLETADFNGDSFTDIAVGCNDQVGDHDLAILLNNGDATFTTPQYVAALPLTSSVKATDFDLDGDIDLLLSCALDSTFAVLYNTTTTLPCGDFNADTKVTIDDAVAILSLAFGNSGYPGPPRAADVDCNGRLNVGDAVYLLAYVLGGGPAPCANCPWKIGAPRRK